MSPNDVSKKLMNEEYSKMDLKETLESPSWKMAVSFHGHVCPGLAIGFKAAQAAMSWLEDSRSADEEIVTISETNACGVDAIQTMTGCTSGKGNLIIRDHGKNVFTMVSRSTGKGVRISLKPGVMSLDPRHQELINLMRSDSASKTEAEEFRRIHTQKSHSILGKKPEEIFVISEAFIEVPEKAKIEPSELCGKCQEPTMPSKMVSAGNVQVCQDCYSRKS